MTSLTANLLQRDTSGPHGPGAARDLIGIQCHYGPRFWQPGSDEFICVARGRRVGQMKVEAWQRATARLLSELNIAAIKARNITHQRD